MLLPSAARMSVAVIFSKVETIQPTIEQMAGIANLPIEILSYILEFLDKHDKFPCVYVCTLWAKVIGKLTAYDVYFLQYCIQQKYMNLIAWAYNRGFPCKPDRHCMHLFQEPCYPLAVYRDHAPMIGWLLTHHPTLGISLMFHIVAYADVSTHALELIPITLGVATEECCFAYLRTCITVSNIYKYQYALQWLGRQYPVSTTQFCKNLLYPLARDSRRRMRKKLLAYDLLTYREAVNWQY